MDIPASQVAERIGRLKRKFGFEMDELKNAIVEISLGVINGGPGIIR